jgi:hypothetical protein
LRQWHIRRTEKVGKKASKILGAIQFKAQEKGEPEGSPKSLRRSFSR